MRERRLLLAMFGVALAFAAVAASEKPAHAKDYHIANIDMRGEVAQDGAMTIREVRNVAFSGDFHWAQWALNTRGADGIDVQSVAFGDTEMHRVEGDISKTPGEGQYIVAVEPGRVVLKVGFFASDRTVPFTVVYKVRGAAKRWKDTSELYWQFVGSETDARTDKVHVQVFLPPQVTKPDVKAWAHGPLNGVVAIGTELRKGVGLGDATYVTLDVTNLAPRTFVEGRILFPASALPGAPVIDQPRAAAVEAEEAKFANEANAQRVAARAVVGLAIAGGIVLPFVLLGVVVVLWFRHGKEYKPVEVQGEYYRDIPEGVSTPLVGALWRMGQPDNSALGATLMDLSLKGAVYMQPVTLDEPGLFGGHQEPTYQLTLDRAKLEQAAPLDRDLATFVFDDTMAADSFTLHGLRDQAKEHPQDFTRGLSAWKSSVEAAANDRGWIEAGSRTMEYVSFGLAVLAGVAAVLAVIATKSPLFLVGLVPAFAAFVLAFKVKRRSREAVELYAKYVGLRNYMRDFGRMQEKPPESVVLWEQYLVLAVIFGIAEEVIAQLRVTVPEVVNDPAFAPAYWWTSPSTFGDRSSPVGSVTAGFTSAVSAANSAMSSSSGGGGGFSGGGGGGGGGGGFSAG